MKSLPLAVAALAATLTLVPAAAGQGLTTCAGLNHLTSQHQSYETPAVGRIAVQFIPAVPTAVERVEWFMAVTAGPNSNFGPGAGIVKVLATDPATGLPGVELAAGSYVDAFIGGGVMIIPPG